MDLRNPFVYIDMPWSERNYEREVSRSFSFVLYSSLLFGLFVLSKGYLLYIPRALLFF